VRGVAAVLALAMMIPAEARAENNRIVVGAGAESCGHWTIVRDQAKPNLVWPPEFWAYTSWVLGFVSAANSYAWPKHNLMEGADGFGVWGLMDNYCKSHPTDTISDAASAVVLVLMHKSEQR